MPESCESCKSAKQWLAKALVCSFGCLPVAASLAADEPDGDPYFDEIPIVLTASRLEQSALDAPAPVTVIDREMIVSSGFTEIHDLMRLVPGFTVADWPDGSPIVTNHGLGDPRDRRIKVLIDGREINSPFWGDTQWQDLPIRVDDLDRIEVVRGPNGAAYGVNAFQGVINLITRPPETEDGTALITRAGSDGFFDVGVRLNSEVDSDIDWRVTASRRAATNFESYRDQRDRLHSSEYIQRNVFNLNASTMLTGQDQLRMQFGVSDGVDRRGNPEDIEFPPHSQSVRALYFSTRWERSFAADSELSVQYYHQEERVRAGFNVPAPQPGGVIQLPVSSDRDARRDDIEVQLNARLSEEVRMMIGAGLRNDSVESLRYFSTSDSQDGFNSQLFGSLTWQPTEPLKLDLGGHLENHDYSGTLFSPRIAANYSLSKDQSLRTSWGISYRAPSLMESNAFESIQYQGKIKSILAWAMDPVDPERVRYIDLGYVAHYRPIGVRLDARIFRESYSRYLDDKSCVNPPLYPVPVFPNLLCRVPPPPNFAPFRPEQKSFLFVNEGAFDMDGAEFSVDWSKPGWGRVVLSQAFIDIKGRGKLLDPDIPRSAPGSMTSVLLIKNLPDRWRASVGYYHNGDFYWMNGGDRVPARDRFDFKLARRLGSASSEDEFSITVQNSGEDYPEFHEGKYRHVGRVFAGLRLTW